LRVEGVEGVEGVGEVEGESGRISIFNSVKLSTAPCNYMVNKKIYIVI
jgi:hypothetical protein